MRAISYAAARKNLTSIMDKVCQDDDPVVIKRSRDQSVVVMSLKDYSGWIETVYLMSSPANARRLLKGIAEIEKNTAKG